MAWEDRNKAEKAQARRDAQAYAKTDDNHTYEVVTAKGTKLTAKGINSAKVLSGKGGSYKKK